MKISFEYELRDGVLYVSARGTQETLEDVSAYGTAIIDAANTHKCKYILCDERQLTYELTTSETFDLAEYYTEYAPTIGFAAIVCKEEDYEDARFFETVSVNRGLQIRVFTTVETAEQWLLSLQKKDR